MLPVLVIAAAGSGATAAVVGTRRRKWYSSKPQRRFKLRLTDNSDTSFQHLQQTCTSTKSSASTAELYQQECSHIANTCHHLVDTHAQSNSSYQHHQHHQQQEQQQAQELEHPYAEEIAALLHHPRCPDFSTAPLPATNSSSSNQTEGQHNSMHRQHQGQQQHQAAGLPSFPEMPPPLTHTPCVWVRTRKQLQQMLKELQGVPYIALDTEHNSQRSYLGMLCLLQLSTGTKDYLVDALALHDHLPLLRPLMADPAVLKILHGGANDIAWLQRDAHVYLVNIFDTERAAQVLGREERSLAHLLRRHCGVLQDKTHQTADWRVRPLPRELQTYARSDVHWLPYLAGVMVSEMQTRSPNTTGDPWAPGPMLTSALQKSNTQTLKLYHKTPAAVTVSNATAAAMRRFIHAQQQRQVQQQQMQQQQHQTGYVRGMPVVAAGAVSGATEATPTNAAAAPTAAAAAAAAEAVPLDELQLLLVKQRLVALVAWRDAAARADDEGPQYILPDAALLDLVAQPPASAKQLLSLVSSHTSNLNAAVQHLPAAPRWEVSAAVKRNALQVVTMLRNAGTTAANGGVAFGTVGSADVTGAAAAAGLGIDEANGSSAGLLLMVNGQMVSGGGVRSEASGDNKKRDKSDGEFRQRLIKKFSAKTQVYDNCRMLSTSGDLLCFCDARKLQWYLDKGLAEMVSDDPPTIRLLFEHKNADQQMGLDGFYSTSRANRCVVCGCEEHYLRYRVVPACYRRCFPAHLKSHRSHDIVLLCVDCHQLAHKAAERAKRSIAAEYGVPLHPTYASVQQLEQQQQQEQQPSTAAAGSSSDDSGSDAEELCTAAAAADTADTNDPADEATAAAAAAAGVQSYMSAYHRGDPRPITGIMLAQQARAAAIALVRFGEGIPAARKRQLEGLVARYVGREVPPATDAAAGSNEPLVTLLEIEAALLAGLGERKRAKTLKKLRKNLTQMQGSEAATAAEAAAADTKAAADAESPCDDSGCAGDVDPGRVAAISGGDDSTAAAADAAASAAVASNGHAGNGESAYSTLAAAADISQLEKVLALRRRPEEQGHMWHGQQVVAAALSQGGEEGLHKLVRTFRQVFVAACQPKYLPANWAVDAVDSREFGEYSVYAKEDVQAADGAAAEGAAAGVAAGVAATVGEATAAAAAEDGVSAEALSYQAGSQMGGKAMVAVDG